MDSDGGASDGVEPLLESARKEGSMMEGLLPPTRPPIRKLYSRLSRVRSAPPLDLMKMSSPMHSRSKHVTRAALALPPPSPFDREGDGSSTLYRAIIVLGIYLLVGLLSFSLLDIDLQGASTSSLVDALYFAIVTMTTVGYGDLVPETTGAKLFTCAFVFTGFGLVGVLVSSAANYLVEKQEKLLVEKVYLKFKRTKEHKQMAPNDGDNEVVVAHWKMLVAGFAVLFHFVAGIVALMYWEGMDWVDSFYVVCVTVTTLGYGDHSFRTQAGRTFAIFWILSSTVCVAQFFLYLAESRTEERQHDIACWALHRPTTPSDLEAADMDGDGVVSAAEFVVYKLKEVGKILEDDVRDILKEFCSLDYDESGTLNLSDIHIANIMKESE